mgnify:CR=1 FL=1
MTRINIVEPEQLTKQHLLAEYRELPRVFTHVLKAIESGKTLDDFNIPDKYTVGKGHVTFFYGKCKYLIMRWEKIVNLLTQYGYDLSQDFIDKTVSNYDAIPVEYAYDYTPTPEEIYLNMYRIANRQYGLGDDNDKHVLGVYNV